MKTFTTRDKIKAALLRMMIDAARDLNEATPDRTEPVNYEYARGQAELIIDTIGLSTDDKEGLISVITLAAPISIITRS